MAEVAADGSKTSVLEHRVKSDAVGNTVFKDIVVNGLTFERLVLVSEVCDDGLEAIVKGLKSVGAEGLGVNERSCVSVVCVLVGVLKANGDGVGIIVIELDCVEVPQLVIEIERVVLLVVDSGGGLSTELVGKDIRVDLDAIVVVLMKERLLLLMCVLQRERRDSVVKCNVGVALVVCGHVCREV